MRQKAKDNDTESFHGKLSCDELNFLLGRGSKQLKSKGKTVRSHSLR
jgi:hypothetical protein